MAILVPDQVRKFPLSQIELVDYSIYDLMARAMSIKHANCPAWTDDSPSDLGNQIVWIVCTLTNLMRQTINQQARNCFLLTADQRQAVRALCTQLGYTLQEASASTVTVTFTCADGHPEFIIAAGTKIGTSGSTNQETIVFETTGAQLITVGTVTVDIPCQQGETVTNDILGSSDGTAYQAFYLPRRPVVWHSEAVSVDEGAGFIAWTRVENFNNSDTSDLHYTVEVDNLGYYYINFADGTNGKIPAIGVSNVRASYRRGGGSAGNVAAGAITSLLTSVDYVDSVTNGTAASGGRDQETIARAKQLAPGGLRANDRIVTADDVQVLLDSYVSPAYGTIAKSVAAGIDNLTTDIRFVPAIGGLPSAGFKAEVKTFLDLRRMVNTEIAVNDPVYYMIDYDVAIWVSPGYFAPGVVEQVRQAIVKYGSPIYRNEDGLYPNEFGEDISLGLLYVGIMGVSGVDKTTVTTPATDVPIAITQIREINSIDIITHEGSAQSSYLNLRKEL